MGREKQLVCSKIGEVRDQFRRGNRRILLIDPGAPTSSMYGTSTPLAFPTLKTIAAGYSVQVDTVNLGKGDRLPGDDYPVVGFTGTSPANLMALAYAIGYQRPDCLVIKGGPAEIVDRQAQKDPNYPIDISFVERDAEISFGRFLEMLLGRRRLERVSGITYNDGKTIVVNPKTGPSETKIVLPDPKFLDVEEPFTSLVIAGATRMIRFQSIRGCLFGCNFCGITSQMNGISPEETVEYLRNAREVTEADSAFCENATFGLDRHPLVKKFKGWTEEFCRLVAPLGLIIGVQTRVDCLDRPTIDMYYAAGIRSLYLGLESGSGSALVGVHKGVDESYEQRFIEMVRYASSQGMVISVSIITDLGSVDDLIRTMYLLARAKVDEIWMESLKIYPGTPMSRPNEEQVLERYRSDAELRLPEHPNPWMREDEGSIMVSLMEDATARKLLAHDLGRILSMFDDYAMMVMSADDAMSVIRSALHLAQTIGGNRLILPESHYQPNHDYLFKGGPQLLSSYAYQRLFAYRQEKRMMERGLDNRPSP